ncbi:hypothetical protein AUJ65_01100 [Candidatus Micrarchaeota archaeon CG1_02_51_15]|nr:MAG: hypothetical protein AUJ65_01100 [Candidatus Micrarchaeota archaeon CG1_02_51_15]
MKKEVAAIAKQQARKVVEIGRKEADHVLAQTRAEGNSISVKARDEAKVLGENEWRKISTARLKARKEIANARNSIVDEAMLELKKELKSLADDSGRKSEYKQVFSALAKQASEEIGANAVLHCRKADVALAKSFGKVGEPIECIGGVIASTQDGLEIADNTFEALLEENSDVLRAEAHKRIFGGAPEKATKTNPEKKKKPATNAKGGRK